MSISGANQNKSESLYTPKENNNNSENQWGVAGRVLFLGESAPESSFATSQKELNELFYRKDVDFISLHTFYMKLREGIESRFERKNPGIEYNCTVKGWPTIMAYALIDSIIAGCHKNTGVKSSNPLESDSKAAKDQKEELRQLILKAINMSMNRIIASVEVAVICGEFTLDSAGGAMKDPNVSRLTSDLQSKVGQLMVEYRNIVAQVRSYRVQVSNSFNELVANLSVEKDSSAMTSITRYPKDARTAVETAFKGLRVAV